MNYNDYDLRNDYFEYVVKKGDSLYTIAKANNTTVTELSDINMLTTTTIYPGQVLLLPRPNKVATDYDFESYVIKNGDSIEKIAKKLEVDPVTLGTYNDFGNIVLKENQVIKIPRSNVYVVKENDTIDTILAQTSRTTDQILKANANNWLKPGTKIYL